MMYNQVPQNIMIPQYMMYNQVPQNIMIPQNMMYNQIPENVIVPQYKRHNQIPENVIVPQYKRHNQIPRNIIVPRNTIPKSVIRRSKISKDFPKQPKKKPNIKLQNTISKDDYIKLSKVNNNITSKYSLCTSETCSNPELYHLKTSMFYTRTKNLVFCRNCFKLGMKGTHGSLCCEDPTTDNKNCFLKATYGFPGYKPRRCSTHKEKNMININVGICQFINSCGERCKEKASYGYEHSFKREKCVKHKLKNMVKIELRKNKKKL